MKYSQEVCDFFFLHYVTFCYHHYQSHIYYWVIIVNIPSYEPDWLEVKVFKPSLYWKKTQVGLEIKTNWPKSQDTVFGHKFANTWPSNQYVQFKHPIPDLFPHCWYNNLYSSVKAFRLILEYGFKDLPILPQEQEA